MKKRLKLKSLLTVMIVACMVLSSGLTVNTNVLAASGSSVVSHFDYFSNVYSHLNDPNHVFKTLTYEDLVNLLESDGNYVVLFGGAWDDHTQADIGFINQVAKQYGVKTIYNFDTNLAGDATLKDANGKTFDIESSDNPYSYFYADIVNKYLTNLNSVPGIDTNQKVHYVHDWTQKDAAGVSHSGHFEGDVTKVQVPFLFVYNKNHKDAQGNPAPIVSSLSNLNVWNDFLTNGTLNQAKVNAYKALVKPVFDAISTNGVASASTIDESAYIKAAFNYNNESTTQATAAKPNSKVIFDDSYGNLVYQHVTYDELLKLLASKGTYVILYGGSWCPNTQAEIKWANEYAKKYNIDKIYMWDTKLDSGVSASIPGNISHNNNELQTRTNNHAYARLYGDMVNTYLTNMMSENTAAFAADHTKTSQVISYSYLDSNGVSHATTSSRLQVPYLFVYNKDNKNADGTSAPILGHVELMYSWQNTQPDYIYTDRDGNVVKDAKGNSYVGKNYQTLTKALDTLFSRLEAKPSKLAASSGKITGVTPAMEYKLSSATQWTRVTGKEITGLTAGTYNVRYASKVGYNGPVDGTGKASMQIYAAGESVNIAVPAATSSSSDLPKTGTPIDSLILIGLVFVLIGVVGYTRKSRETN